MEKHYGEPVFGTIFENSPVAQTKYGKIRGFSRNGVAIFKGIPYGGKCSGDKRFLPPTDPEPWEDILDCTINRAYAMQNGQSIGGDAGNFAAYYKGKDVHSTGELETQGEDCLYLNVLTPGLDGKKRPVVFYIHGGGFSTGSGTMVAAADQWCREEDLLIVGVNHRLNLFGYLYLGAFDAKYAQSGSVGMLDLVKALEWVKDNISNFGGDPDNVTLMGESGGGMKISILQVMKKAKGLFHKAIVESGSGRICWNTPDKAARVTEKILLNLGLTSERWEEILKLPANRLLEGIKTVNPRELEPVADDMNIPDLTQSGYIFGDSSCSAKIPMIIGASEDESGLAPFGNDLTWEQLPEKMVREGLRGPFSGNKITRDEAQRLVTFFRSVNNKHDSPDHTWIKINSLYGILTGGAYPHVLERVTNPEFSAPVFHYMNAYDSAKPDNIRYACAFHTSDLPLQMRIVQRDQDEWMSRIMAHAWAAFIRTGNPSTETYTWPEFTAEDRLTMIFDNNGHTRVEAAPYQKMYELFHLNKNTKNQSIS